MADQLAVGNINVDVTAGIDAVDHEGSAQENDRPDSDAHLNIYQENGAFELGGGPIEGLQPQDREINVTTNPSWDHTDDHFLIDDDDQVQDELKDWINQHLDP